MKKPLNLRCDALGLLVSGALLMTSSLAFAAPVGSKANNCTFVDAVVNMSAVYGTGNVQENQVEVSVADTVVNEGAVRVPAGVAGLSNCGVVHFATESDSVSEIGSVRTASQKFLQMATIFDTPNESNFELISIFDFVQPIIDVATLDALRKEAGRKQR